MSLVYVESRQGQRWRDEQEADRGGPGVSRQEMQSPIHVRNAVTYIRRA